MRNAVLMMMVLGAIVARDCAAQHAFADGAGVVHHGKKVHHGYHRRRIAQPGSNVFRRDFIDSLQSFTR